jgi:transcription regulator MmyB-like protein
VTGPLATRYEQLRARVNQGSRPQGFGRRTGDLTLAFEMLDLPSDHGLSLLTYSAEPGSPSEDAMRELARWSETRTKLSAAPAGPQQPTV